MPSELPEFNDLLEFHRKVVGNKVSYPSEGFLDKADYPVAPEINQQWRDEEQKAQYNINARVQRDAVISFSTYYRGIKDRVDNRLRAFQLMRKRAAVITVENGLLDRLRESANLTVEDGA
jgi:hypothetical protein